MGKTDPVEVDQFFNAFDTQKSGHVDFREVVCGMSVVQTGSIDDRLMMAFKAYACSLSLSLFLDLSISLCHSLVLFFCFALLLYTYLSL